MQRLPLLFIPLVLLAGCQSPLLPIKSTSEPVKTPAPSHCRFDTGQLSEWIKYETDQGVPYWYSTRTQQTQWENPHA